MNYKTQGNGFYFLSFSRSVRCFQSNYFNNYNRFIKALNICFAVMVLTAYSLDGQEIMTPVADLCKPGCKGQSPGKGVELEYGFYPNIKWESETQSEDKWSKVRENERIKAKLKIPVIVKDHINLLLGVAHYREKYRFSSIGDVNYNLLKNIDNRTLKSSELAVYFSKSINTSLYLTAKMGLVFNGDYNGLINFNNRYANHQFGALLGMKKRADREFGVGVVARKGFSNSSIYPFLMYNHTFNDHWGIENGFTGKNKREIQFEKGHILLFVTEFYSRDYSLDLVETSSTVISEIHMRRAQLDMAFEYQHQLSNWIWLSCKGGVVKHFDARFSNLHFAVEGTKEKINIQPSTAPFFSFGIFVAPPKGKG